MTNQELDPWMKGPCEVRANGYVYPCEVVKKAVLGSDNYVIQVLLPSNTKFTMVVEKSLLMSRAHYNPVFDNAKKEKGRREEFLYPIGSFVKSKMGDKKISGVVISYDPYVSKYVIQVEDEQGTYGITRDEADLKLDKKRIAAEKEKRINEMIVPNRETETPALKVDEKISEKVSVIKISAFMPGDYVLVLTNKSGEKETWMPGYIKREDKTNPYTPMSGSRWLISFSTRPDAFEWSYPADRIKKVEKPAVPTPAVDENVEPKFKSGDRVEVIRGLFAGETGVVLSEYKEKIPLKDKFWNVDMDSNGAKRIINEGNLKAYVRDAKAKTEPEPESEHKSESKPENHNEIINGMTEVFNGFFKMAESVIKDDNAQMKVDFKKFVDSIGPIKEYFGKKE